jgi:hypothetical protein
MFNIDTDFSLADQGVWATFMGSDFLIAHTSSMRFQRTLARLQQPHRKKIETGTLDPQQSRDILCKAMSEALLLDWRKVSGRSGDVPYSPDAAYQALVKNPELRDFVTEFSMNLQNYRNEEVDGLGKS